jgi:hypothetical protein
MSDEREKVIHTKNEEPDVEAHAALKASDEKATEDDAETPDVEAHAHLKKPMTKPLL